MTREAIDQAKASFLQAKNQLERSLETTPDDRINWSPSPTARTPVQQVAHAAWAVGSLTETLNGRTFQVPDPATADREFREHDREFDSREKALDLLERNGAAYVAWLDALTPERLDSMIDLPFAMGQAPIRIALTFIPMHMAWHTAQLHYIQTIYGDHDWHM